jgi:hypothetical protein
VVTFASAIFVAVTPEALIERTPAVCWSDELSVMFPEATIAPAALRVRMESAAGSAEGSVRL